MNGHVSAFGLQYSFLHMFRQLDLPGRPECAVPLSSGCLSATVPYFEDCSKYGTHEAPTNWLEILGAICNFQSFVDTHLLVVGSFQLDVVERAHEKEPVKNIFRRGIPVRKRGDLLLDPFKQLRGRIWIDIPNEFYGRSRNPEFFETGYNLPETYRL